MAGDATSTTSIAVSFSALSFGQATGGAVIDSYHLRWDQGTGSLSDLVGQDGAASLLTSYVVSSGVTGGTGYRFQVRAHNVHGWGAFSPEALIYATS